MPEYVYNSLICHVFLINGDVPVSSGLMPDEISSGTGFVCLLVCKGAPLPQRVWAGSSLLGPSFTLLEQGRHSPLSVAKTERHTYSALGSSTQGEWQWTKPVRTWASLDYLLS